MKEFGYNYDEMAEMTQDQIRFLLTGLEVEAREAKAAQRRSKLKRKSG